MDSAARQHADLGSIYREAVSAPAAGVNSRLAERREAAILAESEARRRRIVEGATDESNRQHVALKAWNTPSSFGGDSAVADLENHFDGQGHRAELARRAGHQYDSLRESQENRFGEERDLYLRQHGGNFPPSAPRGSRPPLTSADANRQRAPSPRSFGTVRFGTGASRRGPPAHMPSQNPPQNGIPIISSQLASAVQATAAARASHSSPYAQQTGNGVTTASTQQATDSKSAFSPAMAAAPVRPASPAVSVASSTSEHAVVSAQARIRALYEAQRSKTGSPAPSPAPKAAARPVVSQPTHPDTATSSQQVQHAPWANEPAQAKPKAAFEARTVNSTSWAPSAAPAAASRPAATSSTIQSIATSSQQAQQAQQAPQTDPPARAIAPHLARRDATQTANTGGAVTTGAVINQSTPRIMVPRMRLGEASANEATANSTDMATRMSKARVIGPRAPSPAPSSASASVSTATPAPRSAVVKDINDRAHTARLEQDQALTMRAMVLACMRTPLQLADVEKHYNEFPDHRPLLAQARHKLAQDMVKLAADGDSHAADVYLQGRNPPRRWLYEAAIAARAGATPEDATHPTVQEIVKATKAEQLKKAEKPTTESKMQVPAVTPTAQPSKSTVVATANESSGSSTSAETNSTTASTPTPARPTRGILAAAYYSITGSFLGNKEYPLPVPVTAHINITTKDGEYDPLKLAGAMEAFVKEISGLSVPA